MRPVIPSAQLSEKPASELRVARHPRGGGGGGGQN